MRRLALIVVARLLAARAAEIVASDIKVVSPRTTLNATVGVWPVLHEVRPAWSPTAGGHFVSVRCRDCDECDFAGVRVPVVGGECEAPAASAGAVELKVYRGNLSSGAVPFYFRDAEALEVEPLFGRPEGGDRVRIHGAWTGRWQCDFGGTVVDATASTCVSPASKKKKTILALVLDGIRISKTFEFEYVQLPTVEIAEVFPRAVVLRGHGFTPETTCGSKGTAFFVSHRILACDDAVEVTNDGTHFVAAATLRTGPALHLLSATPRRAPTTGSGAPVIVQLSSPLEDDDGSSSSSRYRCVFGAVGASNATVLPPGDRLRCEPPAAPGAVFAPLSVARLVGRVVVATSTPLAFYYHRPPRPVAINPRSAPVGKTTTRVHLEMASPLALCSSSSSTDLLHCVSPATNQTAPFACADDWAGGYCDLPSPKTPMVAPIGVVVASASAVDATVDFEWRPALLELSAYPATGPRDGGTIVRLRGGRSDDADCIFGDEVRAPARPTGRPGEVSCVSPKGEGNVALRLESTTTISFAYYAQPAVSSVSPRSGSLRGGTQITLRGEAFRNVTALRCGFFGDEEHFQISTPATFVDDSTLRCETPAAPAPGPACVDVTLNGVDFGHHSCVTFTFRRDPVVRGIHPTRANDQNLQITLTGSDFPRDDDLACVIYELIDEPRPSPKLSSFLDDDDNNNCAAYHYHLATNKYYYGPSDLQERLFRRTTTRAADDYEYFETVSSTLRTITTTNYCPNHVNANINTNAQAVNDELRTTYSRIPAYPTYDPAAAQTSLGTLFSGDNASHLLLETTDPFEGNNEWTNAACHVCELGQTDHSPRIGWAPDGFPVYGPRGPAGARMQSCRLSSKRRPCLDECAGYYAELPAVDDFKYRYYYTLGDYHAAAAAAAANDFLEQYYPPPCFKGCVPSSIRDSVSFVPTCTTQEKVVPSSTKTRIRTKAKWVSSSSAKCEMPAFSSTNFSRNTVAVSLVDADGRDFPSSGATFTYLPALRVADLAPSRGPPAGGTRIVLLGVALENDEISPRCVFGGVSSWAAVVKVDSVSCVAPPAITHPSRVDNISVVVTKDDIVVAVGGEFSYYLEEPRIDEVRPVLIANGQQLTVLGSGFVTNGEAACVLDGSQLVAARVMDSTVLSCMMPPLERGELLRRRIEVSFNGGVDSSASGVLVTHVRSLSTSYHRAATDPIQQLEGSLSSISPSNGPRHGGTTVNVVLVEPANRSSSSATCKFGSRAASALITAPTLLECQSPGVDTTGRAAFSAIVDNRHYRSDLYFDYREPMVVEAIEPTSGPIDGGTVVAVLGHGFESGLACSFDDVVSIATFVSTALVRVRAQQRGEVSSASASSPRFKFRRPLTLERLIPSSGSEDGGFAVSARGANFPRDEVWCDIDGKMQQAIWINPTHVTCFVMGPLRLDNDKISIRLAIDGQHFSAALPFAIYPAESIFSVRPARGTRRGGARVVISGTGFLQGASCKFGDIVVGAAVTNSTHLECTAPPLPPNAVNKRVALAVSNNGLFVDHGGALTLFTYADVVVSGAHPRRGSVGTSIAITGAGFSLVRTATCRFGGRSVAALLRKDSELVCETPVGNRTAGHRVPVDVVLDGQICDTFEFSYRNAIELTGLHPHSGPERGGTTVLVETIATLDDEDDDDDDSTPVRYECVFGGDAPCPATLLDDKRTLKCQTQAAAPGIVRLRLREVGGSTHHSSNFLNFEFVDSIASRLSLVPSSGPVRGGTEVLIHSVASLQQQQLTQVFQQGLVFCRFGDNSDAIAAKEGALIRCRSPPQREGSVPVSLVGYSGIIQCEVENFTYVLEPVVAKITPASGPVAGGTVVTVVGSNFGSSLACTFGDIPAVKVRVVSSSIIECETSPASTGRVDVGFLLNGAALSTASVANFFTYYPTPEVNDIHPVSGPERGGTRIVVRGRHFDQNIACDAEGLETATKWVSSSKVECLVSSVKHGTGIIRNTQLQLCGPGNGEACVPGGTFRVDAAEAVDTVEPPRGVAGTRVVVRGRNFKNTTSLRCSFRDVVATKEGGHDVVIVVVPTFVSTHQVICQIPADAEESSEVTVAVANNGLDFSSSIARLRVVSSPPEVLSVAPRSGPIVGGVRVIVSLREHQVVDFACRFGATAVRAIRVVENSVVCVTPAAEHPGRVPFDLTLNAIDFHSAGVFAYYAPAVIEAVSPPFVYADEESVLAIMGSGFQLFEEEDIVCRFGSVTSPAVAFSSGSVQCTVPRLSFLGAVVVAVSNNRTRSTTNDVSVDVVAAVATVSLSPATGPLSGGTVVFVTVNNNLRRDLPAEIICQFGEAAVDAMVVRPTVVRCVSPPSALATRVRVRVGYGRVPQAAASSALFEYSAAFVMALAAISPISGPILGGTRLEVIGHGLTATNATLHCVLEDVSVPARLLSPNRATCTMPPRNVPGSVPIVLTMRSATGAFEHSGVLNFEYRAPARIRWLRPNAGPESGGTLVTIFGDNVGADEAWCRFGEQTPRRATVITTKLIRCVAPPSVVGTGLGVAVSTNGVDYVVAGAEQHQLFSYYAAPMIHEISPTSGPVEGGTLITLSGIGFFPVGRRRDVRCCFGVGDSTLSYVAPTNSDPMHINLLTCIVPSLTDTTRLPATELLVGVSLNAGADCSPLIPFHLERNGRIPIPSSLYPSVGAAGTILEINGEGFNAGLPLECRFVSSKDNKNVVVSSFNVTETSALCVVPTLPEEGAIVVALGRSSSDDDARPVPGFFWYRILPRPLAISPASILETGGVEVIVHGDGFAQTPQLACRFLTGADAQMMMTIAATYESPQSIRCLAPPARPGHACVEVSTNGVDFTSECVVGVNYAPVPVALTATPRYITRGAEDAVIVRGLNYSDVICDFAGVRRAGRALREGVLECTSPSTLLDNDDKDADSLLPLRLLHAGDETTIIADGLSIWYLKTPLAALRLSPAQGSAGNVVAITGTGFDARRAPRCRFGFDGHSTTVPARFVRDDNVECPVPPPRAATATVEVVQSVSSGYDRFEISSRNGLVFAYRAAPKITLVRPAFGSVEGGTRVTIIGEGWTTTDVVSCRFGTANATRALEVLHNSAVCVSPPGQRLGRVNLAVFADDTLDAAAAAAAADVGTAVYEYEPLPSVTAIHPSAGPTSGGTLLTVFLDGASRNATLEATYCRFGIPRMEETTTTTVLAAATGQGVVQCVAPLWADNAIVDVRISVNGGADWSAETTTFEYVREPKVARVDPEALSANETALLLIEGDDHNNMARVTACRLDDDGGRTGVAAFEIDGTLSCAVSCDGLVKGPVDVQLSIDGQQFVSTGRAVRCLNVPTLSSIEPQSGPTLGGTVVTIRGSFDIADAFRPACRFGTTTDFVDGVLVVEEDNAIACVAPPSRLSVGSVVLAVAADSTTSIAAAITTFSYYSPERLLVLEPAVASVDSSRGLPIRIVAADDLGSSARNNLQCVFDQERRVEAFWVDNNVIRCVVPADVRETPGSVSVRVSSNGQDLSRDALTLNLKEVPTLEAVVPVAGPANGGTHLTLYGTGFEPELLLECSFFSFDGQATTRKAHTPATWVSSRQATCVTPPATSRQVAATLEIVSAGGVLRSEGINFYFVRALSIARLEPASGPVAGGTIVRVSTLEEIANAVALSCSFGGISVPATVEGLAAVECRVPRAEYPGAVAVTLRLDGADLTVSSTLFSYHAESSLIVNPSSGPAVGGTRVVLRGPATTFSEPTSSSRCKFGDEQHIVDNVIGIVDGELAVACLTPALADVSTVVGPEVIVSVSLVDDDGVDLLKPASFAYYSQLLPSAVGTPCGVDELLPRSGPVAGGTHVFLTGQGIAGASVRCQFGISATPSYATQVDTNTVRCRAPAARSAGLSPIFVAVGGGNATNFFCDTGLSFEYVPEPVVERVEPSQTSIPGVILNIRGEGFEKSTALTCRIGHAQSPALWRSSTRLECALPSSAATQGKYDVSVANNGIDFGGVTGTVEVKPTQALNNVTLEPSLGPRFGGTRVRVAGSGGEFDEKRFLCVFDGRRATVLVRDNMCTTPSTETIGFVSVGVAHAYGSIVALAADKPLANPRDRYALVALARRPFYFHAPLHVVDVSPSSGPVNGGTRVALRLAQPLSQLWQAGARFMCRFGSAEDVPAVGDHASVLACVSPPMLPLSGGTAVSIALSANGGIDFDDVVRFTTYRPPTILAASPVRLPAEGNVQVAIFGTGFSVLQLAPQHDWACRFGTARGVLLDVIDDEHLTCLAPAHDPGFATVGVSVNGGADWSTTLTSAAVYYASPESVVYDLVPRVIPREMTSRIVARGRFVKSSGWIAVLTSSRILAAVDFWRTR
ncbi:hypothetical protein CTAYLR_004628 [Chrysophaeum taylorii]|uniref:IPT/TIG domain-containing protein n=1 Tax=Chrysophaeum taylorii TaxID=2483200 RepID=A0AAD7UQI2_9STRA|nr:hypothetical protein CTAYLR_004628 [Chrysophaeum taylorii]